MKGFKDSTRTQSGFDFSRASTPVKMHSRAMPKSKGGPLTSAARKDMPKSEFGLPGKRAYPMPDKSHAANAKARATQMVNAGKLSESAKSKIDAKANRILKKAEGGMVGDAAQDKKAIVAAVHKHERHDHPGKPLTKLRRGGKAGGADFHVPLIKSGC